MSRLSGIQYNLPFGEFLIHSFIEQMSIKKHFNTTNFFLGVEMVDLFPGRMFIKDESTLLFGFLGSIIILLVNKDCHPYRKI